MVHMGTLLWEVEQKNVQQDKLRPEDEQKKNPISARIADKNSCIFNLIKKILFRSRRTIGKGLRQHTKAFISQVFCEKSV